ncbi:MAG: histidine phosphatase family protein [Deltaproteobacteria bacterium]|nr:histidine phosphatase family protein [Deltaproteobacteria bacterium]
MSSLCLLDRAIDVAFGDADAVGILVRHAERERIRCADDAARAPLTENGREAARNLGRLLRKFEIHGIFSSVIERCVDTANCIVEGLECEIKIQRDEMLLQSFVADWDAAKKQMFTNNPEEIIWQFLGGKQIPGFLSMAAGSEQLLRFVCENVKNGGVSLFVTHDALIMPFLQHYTNTVFRRGNELPFLGSAVVRRTAGKLFVDNVPVQLNTD